MRKPMLLIYTCALGVVAPVSGQSEPETAFLWPDFTATAGAFRATGNDEIRIDGSQALELSGFDLSADLGLPEAQTSLAASLDWAVGRRHSLGLRYGSIQREGSRTLATGIRIGDIFFPIDAAVSGRFDQESIEASYTYWFVRQDRAGFGASLGVVYLSLDAEVSGTVEIGGTGLFLRRTATAETEVPVPMVGLSAKGSPIDRLVLRGTVMYLPSVDIGKVSGSAASYSLGAEYFILGPVALGASYDGTFYDVDFDSADWSGSADLRTSGFRLYLRAAF